MVRETTQAQRDQAEVTLRIGESDSEARTVQTAATAAEFKHCARKHVSQQSQPIRVMALQWHSRVPSVAGVACAVDS